MKWRRRARHATMFTRRLKSGRELLLIILAMTLTLFMSTFLFETSGSSVWGKLILHSSPSASKTIIQ